MILFLCQSALIVSLFYLFYKIGLKQLTFFNWNRAFLLLGLLLALLLPFCPLNFNPEQIQYVEVPKSMFNYVEAWPTNTLQETNTNWLNTIQNLSVVQAVGMIYWIGFGLMLVRLLLQLTSVLLILQNGKTQYKDGVKFIYTNRELAPFSFFHCIVLNPNQLQNQQWQDVVTHEKIHIHQWHQLDVVLAEILKIVLWFVPISYWFAKEIRTNLEYIADEHSLKNGLNAKNYQLSLLQISQQNNGPILVNSFSKKIIKNRIKMINKIKTNNKMAAVYALFFPLLLLFSFFASSQLQGQEKKIKKVIVITEDGVRKNDVKVQLKNQNGEFQEVESKDVEVIQNKNNSTTKIELKSTENGKVLTEEIHVRKNHKNSFEYDLDDSLSEVIVDKIEFKNKDTIIIKDLTFNMDSILENSNKIVELHFDGDADFDVDSFFEKDNNIKFWTDSDNEFYDFKSLHNKMNISQKEYNNLSKKQKRQLDKIQKELQKTRKKNPKKVAKEFFFQKKAKHLPKLVHAGDKLFLVKSDQDATIYIDGKKSTQKQMDELKPEEIESVSVIKKKKDNGSLINKNEIRITTKK